MPQQNHKLIFSTIVKRFEVYVKHLLSQIGQLSDVDTFAGNKCIVQIF